MDADPPESVMNDPLDDNTVNSRLNSSSSINNNNTESNQRIKTENQINSNATNNNNINNASNNLICFDSNPEQVKAYYIL